MTVDRDDADDVAEELLGYLRKCRTPKEERELVAAYIRRERTAGKIFGIEMVAASCPVLTDDELKFLNNTKGVCGFTDPSWEWMNKLLAIIDRLTTSPAVSGAPNMENLNV